jgi:hypothetical protein
MAWKKYRTIHKGKKVYLDGKNGRNYIIDKGKRVYLKFRTA